MVAAAQRGDALHSTAPPPPSHLAHTDPVRYTRGPDAWKQGACGTPHEVKGDTVSGGQSQAGSRG
jgi:hypothetical protein